MRFGVVKNYACVDNFVRLKLNFVMAIALSWDAFGYKELVQILPEKNKITIMEFSIFQYYDERDFFSLRKKHLYEKQKNHSILQFF